MSVTRATLEAYRKQAVTLNCTESSATSISGWAITFTVRSYPEATGSALITKTVGDGITLTDAANGVFQVYFDADLTPGQYAFDIWRTDTGQETPLLIGTLNVMKQVRTAGGA